jgi:ribosomal protein S18 acetylase RimI-like enzyme
MSTAREMSPELAIRAFAPIDEAAVVELWRTCGLVRDWNDPHRDIQRKLTTQPELFLVGEVSGRIVASVMAGYDGHRGWVNYLAVEPDTRGFGYARTLMTEVERMLTERGCPKLSLQIRSTNERVVAFYQRLGYAVDPVISMGKRLIPDVPARL